MLLVNPDVDKPRTQVSKKIKLSFWLSGEKDSVHDWTRWGLGGGDFTQVATPGRLEF